MLQDSHSLSGMAPFPTTLESLKGARIGIKLRPISGDEYEAAVKKIMVKVLETTRGVSVFSVFDFFAKVYV